MSIYKCQSCGKSKLYHGYVIGYYLCSACETKQPKGKELRDEFAMAALTGMLSKVKEDNFPDETTWVAYRYADAMMEARKK